MISWIATAALILATTVRAFDYSHSMDLLLTFIGCGLWATEGVKIKNLSLTIVNLFGIVIIAIGFIKDIL